MGEGAPKSDGPVSVSADVRGAGMIAKIEICRNNEFIYSVDPGSSEASVEYEDMAPVAGSSYYYLRVTQSDGEIAWSSPVWLGE